jgi:ferrous iron transport protein A
METKEIKPLSVTKPGEKVRLVSIEAGRGLNSRLTSMGILPNVVITIVSNGHPGPLVISVKGSKMMLGRGMAHKIMVRGCDEKENHGGTGRKS